MSADAPAISGTALETLVKQYQTVMQMIKRLSRRFPEDLLRQLVHVPALTDAQLTDSKNMQTWHTALQQRLSAFQGEGAMYTVSLEEDLERHTFLPKVTLVFHGNKSEYILTPTFLASPEYAAMQKLGESLQGLLSEGAYVQRADKQQTVDSFAAALDWLLQEAKRGQGIQRYKGLGEMNPSQLWETTMDHNNRRLLQVTIEDAVAADQLFTCLMGDQVEPRRDFIETNALNASNLDV